MFFAADERGSAGEAKAEESISSLAFLIRGKATFFSFSGPRSSALIRG
jgi:hypothetical protein